MAELQFYIDHRIKLLNLPVLLLPGLGADLARKLHHNHYQLFRDVIDELDWLTDPRQSLLSKARISELKRWLETQQIIDAKGSVIWGNLRDRRISPSGELSLLFKPTEDSVGDYAGEVEGYERV